MEDDHTGTARLGHGSFVKLKTDQSRAGIVQPGERMLAGRRMIQILFQDGSLTWVPETALELVPKTIPPLADRLGDGRCVDPEWLHRTLARLRVTGRLSEMVYSMEATDTDFYAFQFKPVIKLLNSPTDGLLIADEVGLGKTIEAGLIWTELRARLESSRLLVLCPKTLCQKWKTELHNRFGVDASIVNAAELLELLEAASQTRRGFAAIASMQSLRPPRGWNDAGEGEAIENTSARARLARFMDDASGEQPLIDLLIIDEAHHMRNPDTLLHGLARLANEISSHRVLLSATPIHLRNRDLHSLLSLIDPDTFEFETTLDELIEVNAPIIEARDLIMRAGDNLHSVRELLDQAASYPILSGSRSLEAIREQISADADIDKGTRADVAMRLEQVNQLANYVTRTRRRDVQEFRVRRDPKAPHLEMSQIEQEFYDAVTEEVREYAIDNDRSDGFLLATAQRLLSSSPAAAAAYWENSTAAHDSNAEDDTDDDMDRPEIDTRPLVGRLSRLARNIALSERLAAEDTKYALLRRELSHLWREEPEAKVIVFSNFKPTLAYLKKRLAADDVKAELLHGSIRESRDEVLKRFRDSEGATVLLSSEVGSEGVDLQFCWIVVNYDLPWNPMRLEQRIGRVDRLGQAKDKVVVINLVYANTIDERIYTRLYQRLGLGQRALGEFEAVLGNPIREMTQKLLDPRLTEAEKYEAIDQTAQAVENLKREEDALEAQAGSLIRHGDYILQSISDSRDMNRWLSGEDILVYVKDRLKRSFPGCVIEANPAGSDTYRIALTADAQDQFERFVSQRQLRGTTRLVMKSDQQRYRFTTSVVASGTGRIENISQVHPIVRFASALDEHDESLVQSEPVAARLDAGHMKVPIDPGTYVLAIQRWVAKSGSSLGATSAKLAYAGINCSSGAPLTTEQSEALALAVAEHGAPIPNAREDERLPLAAEMLQRDVLLELKTRFDDFVGQAIAQVEDRTSIRRQALKRHRDEKIGKLQLEIERREETARNQRRRGDETRSRKSSSLVEATRSKMRKFIDSCDLRLREIEAERDIIPELSDIAVVFTEVREQGTRA